MRLLGRDHIITGDEWVRMAAYPLISDSVEYGDVPLVKWSPIRSLLDENTWRLHTIGKFLDVVRRCYEFVEFDSREEYEMSKHSHDISLTRDGSDPGIRNVCYRSWKDWMDHWLLFANDADRQAVRDGKFVKCHGCRGVNHYVCNGYIYCSDCRRRTPVDEYMDRDYTDGNRRFRHDWNEWLKLKERLAELDATGAKFDGITMPILNVK